MKIKIFTFILLSIFSHNFLMASNIQDEIKEFVGDDAIVLSCSPFPFNEKRASVDRDYLYKKLFFFSLSNGLLESQYYDGFSLTETRDLYYVFYDKPYEIDGTTINHKAELNRITQELEITRYENESYAGKQLHQCQIIEKII